jgi:hypothetical protein
LCILPLLHGGGKINGPDVLLGLGIYDLDFLVVHEDRGKKGKVCNALVTSVNLAVVNGYGSPDEISFVDLLHIPTLLPWNSKRVIPPRTGLIRLVRSSPFSGFLVNLSKEGRSLRRDLLRASLEMGKGKKLPENGLGAYLSST